MSHISLGSLADIRKQAAVMVQSVCEYAKIHNMAVDMFLE
jgi:hypothetical protein